MSKVIRRFCAQIRNKLETAYLFLVSHDETKFYLKYQRVLYDSNYAGGHFEEAKRFKYRYDT